MVRFLVVESVHRVQVLNLHVCSHMSWINFILSVTILSTSSIWRYEVLVGKSMRVCRDHLCLSCVSQKKKERNTSWPRSWYAFLPLHNVPSIFFFRKLFIHTVKLARHLTPLLPVILRHSFLFISAHSVFYRKNKRQLHDSWLCSFLKMFDFVRLPPISTFFGMTHTSLHNLN